MSRKRLEPALRHYAHYGTGRHSVWVDLIEAGDDLVIYIGGGEKPHIGSISLSDGGGESLTLSVPRHKDYLVSSGAAKKVAVATGRQCLVVAGIHVDRASRKDIAKLIQNVAACIGLFLERYEKGNKIKDI